ncbi:MAG TPA: hypothetical protein VMB47_19245 [Candidatus Aquilonibacter sp.]|nr:hypothetical protein [Candidatus Aquilonibacter sp.]
MNQQLENRLLLTDTLPAFAAELRQLLEAQGEQELAAQVPGLVILDRCRCGDDFCATFYAQPKPDSSYGPGHRNVALTPEEGMLILDVVGGEVACVEVLDRPDVRVKLSAVLP